MDQHRLVDPVAQFGEQAGGAAIGTTGDTGEQVIDRGRQQRYLGPVARHLDAAAHASADRDLLQLLGDIVDRQQGTPLQQVHDRQQARDQAK